MTSRLALLNFPPEWNGSVRCSSSQFLKYRCNIRSCDLTTDNPEVILCTCHDPKMCQIHCSSSRLPFVPATWHHVVRPYLNVAVMDSWTDFVMTDCARKLNTVDPESGAGVLHGLLANSDDHVLLEQLLELGADPELRYFNPKVYCSLAAVSNSSRLRVEFPMELLGGSAMHFAVFYEREMCFATLLSAGASLGPTTANGVSLLDLAKTDEMRKLVSEAVPRERQTLAQLAHAGEYSAIRRRMRVSNLMEDEDGDLYSDHEDKSAFQWTFDTMFGRHDVERNGGRLDPKMAASRILLEMQYRYDLTPYSEAKRSSATGSSPGDKPVGNGENSVDERGVTTQDVGKKLDMILEAVSSVSSLLSASAEKPE